MPEKSSGDILLDLFLGQKEKKILRQLTRKEIQECNEQILSYLHLVGERFLGGKEYDYVSLTKEGYAEAREIYISIYWPSWLYKLRNMFCEIFS
ncbi:MAG: hypothetical protein GF365_04910 [Candidatus Buchananbacteria bacterium]|nr:hypothetical protein [Candidatus Buchananbacteria bacterium]